ncbi:MAG: Respiratory supercomplex factor 1, mitochondrial [Chaenotheca gracillima]|nr:MAG: Respiratory supercomplex factor 1, mitochondrial [Chaenotheca gracillima]
MSNEPLPSSFDGRTDFYEESRLKKFFRRIREEPLVPLGCGLTCYALYQASKSISSGDHNRVNRMFRARIYAQFFTLVAVCAGAAYYRKDRQLRKEYEGLVAGKKAEERRAAWIKELEARDEEEKAMSSRKEAMKLAIMKEREDAQNQQSSSEGAEEEEGDERSDKKGEGVLAAVQKLKAGSSK